MLLETIEGEEFRDSQNEEIFAVDIKACLYILLSPLQLFGTLCGPQAVVTGGRRWALNVIEFYQGHRNTEDVLDHPCADLGWYGPSVVKVNGPCLQGQWVRGLLDYGENTKAYVNNISTPSGATGTHLCSRNSTSLCLRMRAIKGPELSYAVSFSSENLDIRCALIHGIAEAARPSDC